MDEELGIEVDTPDGGAGKETETEVSTVSEEKETSTQDKDLSTEELFAGLDDEDEAEDKKEPKQKDATPSKTDEEKEKEEEDRLAAELDEDDDKDVKVAGASYGQIKKEFPDLFKKYPRIKDDLFAATAFRQIFPSVDDAKEAHGKVEVFDEIDNGVTNGDFAPLVSALAGDTRKSFAKNILPTLHKLDKELFGAAVQPVLQNIIFNAFKEATANGDKNAINASRIFYKKFFGTYNIPEKLQLDEDVAVKAEREKGQQREKELVGQREQEFKHDFDRVVTKELKRSVMQKLSLDKSLTDYAREALTAKIISDIKHDVDQNKEDVAAFRSIWRRAVKERFPRSLVSQLANTYLGRARTRVGPLTSKHLSKAIPAKRPPETDRVSGASVSKAPGGKIDGNKVDWSRTSTADLFAGKPILKK